jgi:hypothetical protein
MRLWSIHPKYLDSKGLVALWRESLLALKVLEGNTKGYKNHSQLNRFKQKPIESLKNYLKNLREVDNDGKKRKINPDKVKISKTKFIIKVPEYLNYQIKAYHGQQFVC